MRHAMIPLIHARIIISTECDNEFKKMITNQKKMDTAVDHAINIISFISELNKHCLYVKDSTLNVLRMLLNWAKKDTHIALPALLHFLSYKVNRGLVTELPEDISQFLNQQAKIPSLPEEIKINITEALRSISAMLFIRKVYSKRYSGIIKKHLSRVQSVATLSHSLRNALLKSPNQSSIQANELISQMLAELETRDENEVMRNIWSVYCKDNIDIIIIAQQFYQSAVQHGNESMLLRLMEQLDNVASNMELKKDFISLINIKFSELLVSLLVCNKINSVSKLLEQRCLMRIFGEFYNIGWIDSHELGYQMGQIIYSAHKDCLILLYTLLNTTALKMIEKGDGEICRFVYQCVHEFLNTKKDINSRNTLMDIELMELMNSVIYSKMSKSEKNDPQFNIDMIRSILMNLSPKNLEESVNKMKLANIINETDLDTTVDIFMMEAINFNNTELLAKFAKKFGSFYVMSSKRGFSRTFMNKLIDCWHKEFMQNFDTFIHCNAESQIKLITELYYEDLVPSETIEIFLAIFTRFSTNSNLLDVIWRNIGPIGQRMEKVNKIKLEDFFGIFKEIAKSEHSIRATYCEWLIKLRNNAWKKVAFSTEPNSCEIS